MSEPEPLADSARVVRGGLLVVAGVGLSLTLNPTLGGILTLSGVAIMTWSLHRFGRTGPDAA